MSNARDKYLDEEWDELEESIERDRKAKKQAIKDIEEEIDWSGYEDGFNKSINIEEDEQG